MRIAVSGTHGSGKTTLVEAFVHVHPEYMHEPEPYETLSELGVIFSSPPRLEDFTEQLTHSIDTLKALSQSANVIFDRCPIDFVAYLEALTEEPEDENFDIGAVLGDVEDAIETLDLVVFLPLTSSDPISRVEIEYPALRRSVDRRLKSIFRDDSLSLFASGRPGLLELTGSVESRLMEMERATLAVE
jgi:hypothetical protein